MSKDEREMIEMIQKYYKLDDSETPGYALVDVIGKGAKFMGKQMYKIQIVGIAIPSTFMKCKIGSKKTVIETLLRDSM